MTGPAQLRPGKVASLAFACLAALLVAFALPDFWVAVTQDPGRHRGADYNLYMSATRAWLGGGGFYLPHQLAGPYPIVMGDVLYPPLALWLFVPFTVLPTLLWWVIPIGVTGIALVLHRPTVVVWPLIALILAWQPVEIHLISGNPDIWALAALAMATHVGGWAVFVLIKPTLAPFALWGVRRRSWLGCLAVVALASLLLAPMWPDWFTVLLNSQNPAGPLYAWQEAPLLLIPVIAWWGSARRRDSGQPAAAEISRGLTARAPSS